MLIDCDTCTVRGEGCADCVVTVLLGAPPGWQGSTPDVVPLRAPDRRATCAGHDAASLHRDAPVPPSANSDLHHVDSAPADGRSVVELDEVEQRAVGALAEFGLVPPIRHQDAWPRERERRPARRRHVS